MLEAHIKRKNNRRPEHADYDPYKKEEEPKGMIELDRMVGRFEDLEADEIEDLEGDVLILDPEKLQKRLPNIKFDMQLGRPEPKEPGSDDE